MAQWPRKGRTISRTTTVVYETVAGGRFTINYFSDAQEIACNEPRVQVTNPQGEIFDLPHSPSMLELSAEIDDGNYDCAAPTDSPYAITDDLKAQIAAKSATHIGW